MADEIDVGNGKKVVVKHISEIMKPMVERMDRLTGLYEKIQSAQKFLKGRDPQNGLVDILEFNQDGFPIDDGPETYRAQRGKRSSEFEKKYMRLIRNGGACMYLDADEKYLEDLNNAIMDTY